MIRFKVIFFHPISVGLFVRAYSSRKNFADCKLKVLSINWNCFSTVKYRTSICFLYYFVILISFFVCSQRTVFCFVKAFSFKYNIKGGFERKKNLLEKSGTKIQF